MRQETGDRAYRQRGQAIVEYLLVAVAVLAAVLAVKDAVWWKTLGVSVNEINKVNEIPRE